MRLFVFLLLFVCGLAQANPFPSNTLTWGDGTATNKRLKAKTAGSGLLPEVRFNTSTSKWQFSNDGSIFTDFGTGTGGGSAGAKFVLSGGVTPWDTIDGFHYVQSSATLTKVDITMGNCSSTGTVVVGIYKNGVQATTATLTSSSGVTCTTEETVSVSVSPGDVMSVNVNSATATGEDLTVELVGI